MRINANRIGIAAGILLVAVAMIPIDMGPTQHAEIKPYEISKVKWGSAPDSHLILGNLEMKTDPETGALGATFEPIEVTVYDPYIDEYKTIRVELQSVTRK